jgi:hypothetical protein
MRATKFETYINLKTAKAFGIAVPNTLIGRADEVMNRDAICCGAGPRTATKPSADPPQGRFVARAFRVTQALGRVRQADQRFAVKHPR